MKRFIPSITSLGVGMGVLAGVLIGVLGGCSTDRVSQVGQEPRAAISDAALASYPQAPAASSDRVQAAAVDQPDLKQVEIFNLADQSIPAGRVWVNGNFLAQINAKAIAHVGMRFVDERANVVRGRVTIIQNEIRVRRRNLCAAQTVALEPCTIDKRAGRRRHVFWNRDRSRIGVLKNAAGAWRVERLRPLAMRK